VKSTPSVMAPRYRKRQKPEWHFVPPGGKRAACGSSVSARIQGTKPIRTITCATCGPIMWRWALSKVLIEMAAE
jgi:hypothetical protein